MFLFHFARYNSAVSLWMRSCECKQQDALGLTDTKKNCMKMPRCVLFNQKDVGACSEGSCRHPKA
ncbi:hypothetical protein HYC85_020821 [Camellia sinensis]|uniref:Uncharacterized protein n=1 Tax=Camellia sinensis TaxID=4442 RepID=A0A7J7GQX3_CAMSI|nr:hypothetical protein HYC85_020821 [Camellia sinensis]